MVRHAKEPGEFYDFKAPLDAEYKICRNWAGELIESLAPPDAPSIVTEPAPAVDECAADSEDSAAHDHTDHVGDFDNIDEFGADIVAEMAAAGESHSAVESTPVNEPPPAVEPILAAARPTIEEMFSIVENMLAQENPPPQRNDQKPPPRSGNRRAGNGFDQYRGDYHDAQSEKHAGKPYRPIRIALLTRGYRVARTFPFTVPGEAAPRFYEDRYELQPGTAPTKERPRKTSRYWHRADGQELSDTGPRRIIYNWPAIMAAGPGATVFITEGANKSEPLSKAGLLATAAPYHQWGPECRKSYVRLDRAKANIVRAIKATWYRLISVPIGNATELYPEGDEVQALEAWVPPDAWLDLDAAHINSLNAPRRCACQQFTNGRKRQMTEALSATAHASSRSSET